VRAKSEGGVEGIEGIVSRMAGQQSVPLRRTRD
jgi:hypothetical protein